LGVGSEMKSIHFKKKHFIFFIIFTKVLIFFVVIFQSKFKTHFESKLELSIVIITKELYKEGHLISPSICPNADEAIKLLVVVFSAPDHQEARQAIRETWGNSETRGIAVAFIIGIVDQKINDTITAEILKYDDIIQGNFMDSYFNLTLKTISMLEWVEKNCQSTKFILKVDDDVFINIPKLLEIIKTKRKETRTIFGRLAVNWPPHRETSSKYYLDYKYFQPNVFPDFTTGPAYLMTSDCVSDLFAKSLNLTFMPKLEDVYITGLVAQEMNITRTLVKEFVNERGRMYLANVKRSISFHDIRPAEQYVMWKMIRSDET